MRPVIQLLGSPTIEWTSGDPYRVRSRKSWALLAYLILGHRPPARSELTTLFFPEADDPLRALRWNLSEIRRALGDGARLEGDPVVLVLPPDAVVDVEVVTRGAWSDAIRLPGLGADLLEGFALRDAATFATWLLSEQRRVAAAAEAILHEAAVASSAANRFSEAIGYAVRATTMSPLDENHHALLIRLYRLSGDPDAAWRQYETCRELLRSELGIAPGDAIEAALHLAPRGSEPIAEPAAVEAVLEAGKAAIAAGAVRPGLDSLRAGVHMADRGSAPALRLRSRLVLAEALIHSLGGLDEEGVANLHEADRIASAADDRATVAEARAELGYIDFLRARYDRAEHWLTQSLAFADDRPAIAAKATTYLGCVESDRANYPAAVVLLEAAVHLARAAEDPRRESFAGSMLGRVHLLRRDLGPAAIHLDAAMRLAEDDHWLTYLPWPQALRGEVELAHGDLPAAAALLQQAFARACQSGDPCWEGIAARGVALVDEARGETDRAFAGLIDARERCNRLADPYVWLDAYILDALCELGRRHHHPDTGGWITAMRKLTARTSMRELEVRALRHSAAFGEPGAADAARLLAIDIDNPVLAPAQPVGPDPSS